MNRLRMSTKGILALCMGISSLFRSATSAAAPRPFTSLKSGIPNNAFGILQSRDRRRLPLVGKHCDSAGAPLSCGAALLDRLRGGAEEAKTKEATKSDEEEIDLDKILESEVVAEIDNATDASADEGNEDDEVEGESDDMEQEEDEEEEEEEAFGTDLEEVGGYDEPLVVPAMLQLYATFGVMMLSKRIDLFSPTVVRVAR